MIPSRFVSNKKMNRSSKRHHRRTKDELGLPHHTRYTSFSTMMNDVSRTTLDSSFVRTVSKDDHSLGPRFEPPIKKPRAEGRYDELSATIHKINTRHLKSYHNPTMKSYQTIEQLVRGAYENRSNLVPSSIAAFWTRTACLLEEDNDKSSWPSIKGLNDEARYFLSRTEDTLQRFGSNNMSQTLTAFGKIVKNGRNGSPYQLMFYDIIVGNGVASKESIFIKIANVAVHKLQMYDTQALSTTAITFARIGVVPILSDGTNFFNSIAYHSMRSLRKFNPQGLSTLSWAFATVDRRHEDLFKMIADCAISTIDQFNPQNLSNLAWAFAKTNQPNPCLFKSIAQESLKYIYSNGSCSQNISNSLWSFAHVELYDVELFDASAKRILHRVDDFKAQELANSASAFASSGKIDNAVFKALGDEAIKKLSSFTTQNLANIVHAFAIAGVSHSTLFHKVSKETMHRLHDFNPQEIANLSWAFAKAKEIEPELFAIIAEETLQRLQEFVQPQHISNLIWAFATAKLPHKTLFEVVADVVIEKEYQFSPQQVSNLLWSYSILPVGSVNKRLCKAFESVIFKSIASCDIQFFANVAWSYAVANVDAPYLFGKKSPFICAIISRQQEFNLEAFCQLHQFVLWRKELKAEVPFPSTLQHLCYNSYIAREPSPSAFQDFVIEELKAIGFEPQEEYLTSTGYSLDALIKLDGESIGIEVDGPFHFAGKGQPLGKMTLKHRQVLNVEGIRIVSIPYYEWEGCIDKKSYLKSKLDMTEEYDEFKWVL